jgi:OmpA-OmpF porin, OOP family
VKIKNILVTAAAFSALGIVAPAQADDGKGAYVGIEGGVSIAPKSKIDVATTPKPTANGIIVKNKMGSDIALIGGYDFGPFRTEIELSQKSNSVGRVDTTVDVPTKFNTGTTPPTVAKGPFPNATGSTKAKSAMLNVIGDIGPSDGVNFFVGAGLGLAEVKASKYSVAKGVSFLNDKDSGFAWQLMTGVRVPLSESIEAGVKYKYFRTSGVDMVDTLKRKTSANYSSHGVLASLNFRF